MRIAFRIAVLSLALATCVAGSAWSQEAKRMKITVANYQIEPTDPNGDMLKYYGDKFGVDFEVVNINNDKYHEILNLKLAAGEIPDLFYLKDPATLTGYVKQGVVAKIPMDMFNKNAPDLVKVINDNAPGYMNMGRVNGAQYGIPAVNPTNRFHIPLVYRSDWMKKVGVTKTPETLAEFESLMYKFARNDPDGNGKNDTYGLSSDGLNAVFGAFGLVPFDHSSNGGPGTDYWLLDGQKVVNSSVMPAVKDALALMAKWYKDGIIDPEFITGENQGGYWALSHAFIKGRIGFSTRANYYHWAMPGSFNVVGPDGTKIPSLPGAVTKELLAANPAATLAFGQSLKGPTGKQGIKEFNSLMNFFCVSRLVEKDQAKMAKIFQILNESANPDFTARTEIKRGKVGTHWETLDLETETIRPIPPFDKDTGYMARVGLVLWITVPFPPKAADAMWAYSLKYDKFGIRSLVQVGLPEVTKSKADLMKFRDETYIAIITGAKPVSYFGEFTKKYMEMGGKAAEDAVNVYYKEMSAK